MLNMSLKERYSNIRKEGNNGYDSISDEASVEMERDITKGGQIMQ